MHQSRKPRRQRNVLGVFGVPGIDVGLVAGAQAALPLGEPVEESRGLFNLVVGELAAGGADRLVLGAGSKSWQDLPGGEPLNDLGVVAVGECSDMGDEPAFEQADLLIEAGQDLAGHQQLTQVCGGSPRLQRVKRLVGQLDVSSAEPP